MSSVSFWISQTRGGSSDFSERGRTRHAAHRRRAARHEREIAQEIGVEVAGEFLGEQDIERGRALVPVPRARRGR